MSYIAEKGTVTVAVPDNRYPRYRVYIDDYHEEFVPDVLEKVMEYSGLQFTYLTCHSYMDAINMIQEGKADMPDFLFQNRWMLRRRIMSFTLLFIKIITKT